MFDQGENDSSDDELGRNRVNSPSSTPQHNNADDDDRMSLSSLSSGNEQIIEQPLEQNQIFPYPLEYMNASVMTTSQMPSTNPLIPTFYQHRDMTPMSQPVQSTALRPVHVTSSMQPRISSTPFSTIHPVVAQQSQLQPRTSQPFYGDQFGQQMSFWNQTHPYVAQTPESAAAAAYYSYGPRYDGPACSTDTQIKHLSSQFMPSNNFASGGEMYILKEYMTSDPYPQSEEKKLHLSDSRVANSPHFKTIEYVLSSALVT
jgi:hypothetical protein